MSSDNRLKQCHKKGVENVIKVWNCIKIVCLYKNRQIHKQPSLFDTSIYFIELIFNFELSSVALNVCWKDINFGTKTEAECLRKCAQEKHWVFVMKPIEPCRL